MFSVPPQANTWQNSRADQWILGFQLNKEKDLDDIYNARLYNFTLFIKL